MKKLWSILVIGLICFVSVVSLFGEEPSKKEFGIKDKIGSIYQITDDKQRLQAFDDLAKSLNFSKVNKNSEEKGAWEVSVKKDPMDDSNKITISLDPSEKVAGFYSPSLIIRYSQNKMEIYFYWGNYLAENNKITLRYDQEKAFSETWTMSSDNTATFCPKPSKFILKLLKHDKIAVQVTPYNEGPMTVVYDISGLKGVLGEYEEFDKIWKGK